jgi:hypothetical protein
MGKVPRRARRSNSSTKALRAIRKNSHTSPTVSTDAIKAAEQTALAAFASGLKVAAAFGSVAAKTTSLALASLAAGADRFSELVKKEALESSRLKTGSNLSRKRNLSPRKTR